ncbi:MAG: hypothetical protein ABS87_07920 [Sphingomonas sp. SCN 67-18]|nr:MAG: hypothetical protein ABS87_07920 [Sphingomonas sp. SCN 67-18]
MRFQAGARAQQLVSLGHKCRPIHRVKVLTPQIFGDFTHAAMRKAGRYHPCFDISYLGQLRATDAVGARDQAPAAFTRQHTNFDRRLLALANHDLTKCSRPIFVDRPQALTDFNVIDRDDQDFAGHVRLDRDRLRRHV